MAEASPSAGPHHSSEGGCEFTALTVNTYVSIHASVGAGNRCDTQKRGIERGGEGEGERESGISCPNKQETGSLMASGTHSFLSRDQ